MYFYLFASFSARSFLLIRTMCPREELSFMLCKELLIC